MKLSTDPYKGVRDFYPEDKRIQNYIFNTWKKVSEKYGYVEYDASILEPSELYESKTSEEIINEQTYTFIDRGDRRVTLRTEMTPTVARMVASKRRDYALPLRWYSIPNCFRYERPQRGRLREFWQLNVDIFGVEGIEAEVEIISLARDIMSSFGLKDENYEIQVNDRRLIDEVFSREGFNDETTSKLRRLFDKKDKIDNFEEEYEAITGRPYMLSIEANESVTSLLRDLAEKGIRNAVFNPFLMRGFDYYSGIVFEIRDNHPDNRRALFGGGRYDNLLSLFSDELLPAFGFGMGDVTIRDVLGTYNLIPESVTKSTTDVYIAVASEEIRSDAEKLADELRSKEINVALDISGKKLGDQIKKADKDQIPYVLIVGSDEVATNTFTLKHLSSGNEEKIARDQITNTIRR